MKIQIKSRFTGKVLFAHDAEDNSLKLTLEAAVKVRADLSGAYLSGADLSGANLRGAYLRGADLRDADLSGANLRGAYLRGADLSDADLRDADLSGAYLRGANFDIKPASLEKAVENLDKVREIILGDSKRLRMDLWHETDAWQKRTCAEESTCGTAHCLAGWLQVCATDERVRKLESAQLAGTLQAPVAAKMFFKTDGEVEEWLRTREYAK